MPTLRRDSHTSQKSNQTNPKWQEVAARSEEIKQLKLEEADASLPSMFQKLRRNSKHIFHASSSSSGKRNGSVVQPELQYLRLGEGKLTFFDLPAEIRNQVYEDVAEGMKLYIPCTSAKRKERESKTPPQTTPALLLVSRQTRLEYLPLLLERAAISFAVRDFDFRNLMRVSSSLYSSELKALRKNPQLMIRLLAAKASKDSVASLRRWAQRRTEDMYTLPLSYDIVWPRQTQLVPTSSSVHRINTYIQRRGVLTQNLEALSQLFHNVPEALQFELQPVIDVFETELNAMNHGDVGMQASPWGQQYVVPMFGRRV